MSNFPNPSPNAVSGSGSNNGNWKFKEVHPTPSTVKEPMWKFWSQPTSSKNSEDTKLSRQSTVAARTDRGIPMDRPGRAQRISLGPPPQRSSSISGSSRASASRRQAQDEVRSVEMNKPLPALSSVDVNTEYEAIRLAEELSINTRSGPVLSTTVAAVQQATKRNPKRPASQGPRRLPQYSLLSGKETAPQLRQMIENMETAHTAQINDLENSHDAFVRQLQDEHHLQRTAERQQHHKEISCFAAEVENRNQKARREKEESDKILEELKTSHNALIDEQVRDHHRKIEEAEAYREDELTRTLKAHQDELSRLKKVIDDVSLEAERAIAAQESQHAKSQAQQRHVHEAAIHQLRDEHSTELKKASNAHEREVSDLKRSYQQRMFEVQERSTAELSRLKKMSESRLKEQENEHQDALEERSREVEHFKNLYNQEIREVKTAHAAELSRVNDTLEQRLKGQDEKHEKAMRAASEEPARSKQSHDEEMEKTKRDHAAEISQLTQTYEANGKQAMSVFDREKLRLQSQIQELNAALSEQHLEMCQSSLLSGSVEKTELALKDDFLKVQRLVEDVAGAEWKQDDSIDGLFENVGAEIDRRQFERAVVQHIVWNRLFQFVFASPFRVFGQEGLSIEKEWAAYCGQGDLCSNDFYAWPSLCLRNERWRSMTMAGCRDVLISPLSQYDPRAQLKKGFRESLDALVSTLKEELGEIIDIESQEQTRRLIERVPKKAAAMWVELAAQHCRIMIRPEHTSMSVLGVAALLQNRSALNLRPELGRYGDVDDADSEVFRTIEGCVAQSIEIQGGEVTD